MSDYYTKRMNAIICPNCGHRFTDSCDFVEDSHREQEVECEADCGATFYLNIDIETFYTTGIKEQQG